MPDINASENINNTYFKGYYKEIWRFFIPEQFTEKEINFLLGYFKLEPGNCVLDIMCGYGRHSIGLARKGIAVTAVDILEDYIVEINEIKQKEKLPLTAVCDNVLQFNSIEKFDLAICMGNSLNFFDQRESESLLSKVSSLLKPQGSLLINTWSLCEIVARNFQEKSQSKVGDFTFLADCKYLFHPSRIEIDSIITAPDGTTERKKAIDYIFSLNEMENMLNRSGLELKENFSIPGKKKFSLGDVRSYLIAGKMYTDEFLAIS